MKENLIFVKLGGSLITEKYQQATPRLEAIDRLAIELLDAMALAPHLKILLGHGSGSFGHWEASKYGTRSGVHSAEEWNGYAEVSAAASRLNRVVVDRFLKAGVPILSLQPSASASTHDGAIMNLAVHAIEHALQHNLVPLIFGDVAFDDVRGGTIMSTEDLFVHLAHHLRPDRVLLLGNAQGVLDDNGRVIPCISPSSYPRYEQFLRGSGYTDVTGGMADKVTQMLKLVEELPSVRVWILTGRAEGNLHKALLKPNEVIGTEITHDGM